MGCFRGSGACGREWLSKALSCVPLVIFCLLSTATAVTAPLKPNVSRSVSSAVQEPLLTDEVVALQEIARALKRNLELLSNNWSWIKVGLLSFGVLFVMAILTMLTGVVALYLADLGRKKWPHWESLRPPKEVASLRAEVAGLLVEVADLGRKKWPHWESLRPPKEVASLRAEVLGLRAEVANQGALIGALQDQVANLLQARIGDEATNRKDDGESSNFIEPCNTGNPDIVDTVDYDWT